MADYEEKQEEKFDFTAKGEVSGYIFLAQARLLATQTARETPGNFGKAHAVPDNPVPVGPKSSSFVAT